MILTAHRNIYNLFLIFLLLMFTSLILFLIFLLLFFLYSIRVLLIIWLEFEFASHWSMIEARICRSLLLQKLNCNDDRMKTYMFANRYCARSCDEKNCSFHAARRFDILTYLNQLFVCTMNVNKHRRDEKTLKTSDRSDQNAKISNYLICEVFLFFFFYFHFHCFFIIFEHYQFSFSISINSIFHAQSISIFFVMFRNVSEQQFFRIEIFSYSSVSFLSFWRAQNVLKICFCFSSRDFC